MEMNEKQQKSMKIYKSHRTNENQWKCLEIYENPNLCIRSIREATQHPLFESSSAGKVGGRGNREPVNPPQLEPHYMESTRSARPPEWMLNKFRKENLW